MIAAVICGLLLVGTRGGLEIRMSQPPPAPPREVVVPAYAPTPGLPDGSEGGSSSVPADSASTDTLAVTLPAEWAAVDQNNDSLFLQGPEGLGYSLLILHSETTTIPTTGEEQMQLIIGRTQRDHPDARICGQQQPGVRVNGPAGILFALCYSEVTSPVPQHSLFPAIHQYWVATNDPGTVVYMFEIYTRIDNAEFLRTAADVAATVQWKLP
jgi:hypothetical protein